MAAHLHLVSEPIWGFQSVYQQLACYFPFMNNLEAHLSVPYVRCATGLWAFVESRSIIDKAPETVEQVESELLQ